MGMLIIYENDYAIVNIHIQRSIFNLIPVVIRSRDSTTSKMPAVFAW